MEIPKNAAEIAADVVKIANTADWAQIRRWRNACCWLMPDTRFPELRAELSFTANLCDAALYSSSRWGRK